MRRWRGRTLFIKMSGEERGMTKRAARRISVCVRLRAPPRRVSSLPLSASHIRFAFNSRLTIRHDRVADDLTLLIYIWMLQMSGIAHRRQRL